MPESDWFDMQRVALFAMDEETGLPVHVRAKDGYLVLGASVHIQRVVLLAQDEATGAATNVKARDGNIVFSVPATQHGELPLGSASVANGDAAAFTPLSGWLSTVAYSSAMFYVLNKSAAGVVTLVVQSSPNAEHPNVKPFSSDASADPGQAATVELAEKDCLLKRWFRLGAFATGGPVNVSAALRFVTPG